jgi:hypothetical protein
MHDDGILEIPRYIKVKVEHYLLFMFSPPKMSWVVSGIKYICLHLLPVFYLIQPSGTQIICFDFQKQNSVLPIVFYVPWEIQTYLLVRILRMVIIKTNKRVGISNNCGYVNTMLQKSVFIKCILLILKKWRI